MIGRLNHVAIAVPDVEAAVRAYRDCFGATVSEVQHLPEHGVSVAFVELPNTRIEFMEPMGADSPIAGFLVRKPDGGVHHLCYEVENIAVATSRLVKAGMRVLGDGKPKIGAHGRPILFLHPKDWNGTLIEIEEA